MKDDRAKKYIDEPQSLEDEQKEAEECAKRFQAAGGWANAPRFIVDDETFDVILSAVEDGEEDGELPALIVNLKEPH